MSATDEEMNWHVYLLQCSDGSYYCGVAKDVWTRLQTHNEGKGARYTKGRRPCALVARSAALTKSEAFRLERKVKRMPADKKAPFVRSISPSLEGFTIEVDGEDVLA